ncbi:CAAX prenyl protease-like protein [Microcella putealis]|uniref:CAAX prenyl protease-like protein n=1 Tax=Microcella putealis TaxID=337005 RepID=A0A4Q7LZN2_9MICO|nr:type II CAAX endopeptidase family protein [Microcella putealis]RZS59598.1 CAAX prenyl protease-like protein [Microcella putealis]TQM26711.1 CAAX prenyl protease-like protein [Microcella putealis]
MLDAEPWMRVLAALVAVGMLAAFLVRAIRKDRREFTRFRRYRSTIRRQSMMRRWLIESAVTFGASGALVLIVVHPFAGAMLEQTQQLAPVAAVRGFVGSGLGIGMVVGAAVGLVILTIVGVRGARREGGVLVVGNIAALLPRNRPELRWGAALSLNAGVSEELLFRLALPALLVIVTGEPISAFLLAALVFGLLHAYQGPIGVIATTLVGLVFTAIYVVTGSIVVAMVLHALFDLRTLVIIPAAVYRVDRIPGTIRFPKPLPLAPAREKAQPASEPDDAAADAPSDAPSTSTSTDTS